MRYFQLEVGDAASIDLDANQVDVSPITLYEGPIESTVTDSLGTFDTLTRLYGRVWTDGPQVVIRYYQAQPPGGVEIPICAVARVGKGQLRKLPDSRPGIAIVEFSTGLAFIVNEFR